MTQQLLSPVTLGDLELPNRVAHAPMTRTRAEADGTPTALMAEYYSQRASAGLLIAEATAVSDNSISWQNMPGAFKPQHVEGWKLTTDAVHGKGGKIFLQIWHPGRATHSLLNNGQHPVAPSPIPITGDQIHTPEGKKDYETPNEITTDEIKRIVADFKQAALYAEQANFDGVEIHGANGYLIDQFLQTVTNQRSDSYGGSIENRYRFLDEVVNAVLEVYPANRVGVRLAPNGVYNDMGSPEFREQFLYAGKQLDRYGLAYLHVMDGLAFGFHEKGDPLELSEFRKVFGGTLMGNCGYTKEAAEARIVEGNADLIAFGIPFISTPDLVERFAQNLPLNPELGQEHWYGDGAAKGYTDQPTAQEAGIS
ncbi:alkene reductase [Pelagicoccus mobilis]|uniref:Alkene reductase n=1 Tax=Pelagicoccus mobilis TaxID=415221 RepID=A0A934RVL7_9BACT|nr:alkene reductase [Pelagicoccus mobilis]MBK1876255.1 alkene reductase [Pelagicoccus mobilis]